MKAILIQDHDIKALLDALQVNADRQNQRFDMQSPEQRYVASEVYSNFRRIVIEWAEEHGAAVIR